MVNDGTRFFKELAHLTRIKKRRGGGAPERELGDGLSAFCVALSWLLSADGRSKDRMRESREGLSRCQGTRASPFCFDPRFSPMQVTQVCRKLGDSIHKEKVNAAHAPIGFPFRSHPGEKLWRLHRADACARRVK